MARGGYFLLVCYSFYYSLVAAGFDLPEVLMTWQVGGWATSVFIVESTLVVAVPDVFGGEALDCLSLVNHKVCGKDLICF